LVTICTVGYGDITPETTEGRFFDMAIIITAIIVVPQVKILSALDSKASYFHLYV